MPRNEAHTGPDVDTSDIRTFNPVLSHAPMPRGKPDYEIPVSPATNWVEVNSDCEIQQVVTIPGNLDHTNHPELKLLDVGHSGTSVLVRMKYPQGVGTATSIRVFGFDGSHMRNNNQPVSEVIVKPKPQLLPDIGNNTTITFTPDISNDPQDADGFAYTMPVRIDFLGNSFLLFPVVAADGQGSIEARVI